MSGTDLPQGYWGRVVESIGEGVVTVDLDYRIVAANRAFLRHVGNNNPRHVIGRRCFHVTHRHERPCYETGVDCPVRRVFETDSPATGIHLHPVGGRDLEEVAVAAYPLKNEDGNTIQVVEVIKNLSEVQRATEKVHLSEEKYRNLFHSCNDAIFIHDLEGFIFDVNSRAEALFGYSRRELDALAMADLYPPDALPSYRRACQNLVRDGHVRFEIAFKKKDGTVFPGEMSARIFPVKGEKMVQGIVRDITEHHDAEKASKDYARKLETMNYIKDLFTDIISHDLLNPASVVSHASFILASREHSRDAKEVDMIERNAQKIMHIVRDAAKYTRVENTESLTRKQMDLGQVVTSAIESLQPAMEEKGIAVKFEPPGAAPVSANPMIEEVFANLISNAVKYSPAGTQVTVTMGEKRRTWIVTVADRGTGVPDEYKEAVFERFTRGDKKGVKGTGLGLAIARRIVELHGGDLRVEDNPGGGSLFHVRLPKEEKRGTQSPE